MFSLKQKAGDAPTDRLPARLPATPRRERMRLTSFGGLDMGGHRPWSMADMKNLSPRKAPFLATRLPRELLCPAQGSGTPHGMALMEGDLYFVEGRTLFRIADVASAVRAGVTVETVGTLSDTDKILTVFDDRLLILPDKQYVDAADGLLHPMELDSGVLRQIRFSGRILTLPAGASWQTMGFRQGDSIYVINADDVNPAPEGYYRLEVVTASMAMISSEFPVLTTSDARIKRVVPDMDGMGVCGNRLFGYRGKEIYIGAEGETFGWQGEQADGRGPATLHAGSEGDITACAQWQSYMMFFKHSSVLRVVGNRSDSFSLVEMAAPGIPKGLAHTLCEICGELYYQSDAGVYRFGTVAQKPVGIGKLGDARPVGGCGGTDGECYYLDLVTETTDGIPTHRRYLYKPGADTWYAEDNIRAKDTVSMDGFICTRDADGRLWVSRADGRQMGCAVRESDLSGPIRSGVTFCADYAHEPDGYRPVNLYLRATSRKDAELRVRASFADGRVGRDAEMPLMSDETGIHGTPGNVTELSAFAGEMQDRLLRIPLPPVRCDHMILTLDMIGEWEIGALITEYELCGQ